ncbi:hypothetical protein F5986_15400 [Dickeya dianthicola]|nr:hypothetical protein [Dickeya dianthicola]
MVRETNSIADWREAILWSIALQHLVVILVVLTTRAFRFSLFISQLLAKAIPVRGARFRKARSGKPERAFCFLSRLSRLRPDSIRHRPPDSANILRPTRQMSEAQSQTRKLRFPAGLPRYF